ncbi:MAG: HepT-like ribonuclease domain-containing protein [Clostridia bacterium]
MSHEKRDTIILKKVLSEIADIEAFVTEMTDEDFCTTKIAQKAVTMSLINIGELSKSFSEAFLDETKQIPWRDIRGLRNLPAHHYEGIDMNDLWHTIQNDVPALKSALTAIG